MYIIEKASVFFFFLVFMKNNTIINKYYYLFVFCRIDLDSVRRNSEVLDS